MYDASREQFRKSMLQERSMDFQEGCTSLIFVNTKE